MKFWEKKAIEWLERSMKPFPQELNEIDWKCNLSEKTERLSQHLSAFSNYEGGGFLVFGVCNGVMANIEPEQSSKIVNTLGNIARNNLEPPIILDYCTILYQEKNLLFIKINEAQDKPVHLRSGSIYDSYIRSAGQTRKMDKKEVASAITKSQGIRFEDGITIGGLSIETVLKKLNFISYFDLVGASLPNGNDAIVDALVAEKLVRKNGDLFDITNLGGILFAKNIEEFSSLNRKTVRVIIYDGGDRLKTLKEIDSKEGYAAGFDSLIGFINSLLPTNEVIKSALRTDVKMYPSIAIRELVANALIHQDFDIGGTGPMIEIFSDRIEITNPGRPLVSTLRLIDSPPQSRNEKIASIMRRFKICEERGSGIDKVVFQSEFFQLPAPDFTASEKHFKATLFAYRPLSQMNKDAKIRACYQHCCLKFVSGQKATNSSLRDRFKIPEKNYPIASNIISDTIKAKLIKPFDVTNKSKRYICYIPFWA